MLRLIYRTIEVREMNNYILESPHINVSISFIKNHLRHCSQKVWINMQPNGGRKIGVEKNCVSYGGADET